MVQEEEGVEQERTAWEMYIEIVMVNELFTFVVLEVMDFPFKLLSHMWPVLSPHSPYIQTENPQDGPAASDFFVF